MAPGHVVLFDDTNVLLMLEVSVSDEQEQKSKPLKWKCPECGNVLTTYVPLSQSPYCSNPEKHPKKSVTMVPK